MYERSLQASWGCSKNAICVYATKHKPKDTYTHISIRFSSYSWPPLSSSFSYMSSVPYLSSVLLAQWRYRIRDRISLLLEPESILLPDIDLEGRHAIRNICNVFGQQEYNKESQWEPFCHAGHVTCKPRYIFFPLVNSWIATLACYSRKGWLPVGGVTRHDRLHSVSPWSGRGIPMCSSVTLSVSGSVR